MKRSETITAIAPAWVAALNKLELVGRDNTGNYGTYATIGATLADIKPVFAEFDIAVSQEVLQGQNANGQTIIVQTLVTHSSGEWFESEGTAIPQKQQAGPQDIGSAITYARRYDLQTFLGMSSEDDDGQRAQDRHMASHAAPVEPHPLADRIDTVLASFKRMTDTQKEALREWADGRKLSGAAMLRDETWLASVESYLSWQDERLRLAVPVETDLMRQGREAAELADKRTSQDVADEAGGDRE